MKKKKIVSLALAVSVSATALLAGTYAWHSISQKATNEARNILNPGGRLHDDFTGMNIRSSDDKLKYVYVENFTEENGGERIYARVRLDEYLEIGKGAGTSATDKSVEKIGSTSAEYDQTSTWTTYKWGETTDGESNNKSVFRDYVNINIGEHTTTELSTATASDPIGAQGKIYYMPTFNKDKDNTETEINGTLGGKDRDVTTDKDAYLDFIAYGDGSNGTVKTEAGIEIYAENEAGLDEVADKNLTTESITQSALGENGKFTGITKTVAEGKTTYKIALMDKELDPDDTTSYDIVDHSPANASSEADFTVIYVDLTGDEVADIRLELSAAHEAKQNLETAKLISMEEWLAIDNDDDKSGNFWVYDTDGWAYWAQAIEPGTASGCLISGVSVNRTSGKYLNNKEFYYGLNVVAQCATAGDWGSDESGKETGFYIGGFSKDAEKMMNTISGMTKLLNKADSEVDGD